MKKIYEGKEVGGFRLVFGYLGMFMVLIGAITAIPLIIVAFYHEEVEALGIFGGVVGFNIVVGLALHFAFIFHRKRARFQRHQESLLLILTWLMAVLSGAAPFFIASLMGKMNMSFTAAFFESASGYSTTGLTVFSDFIDVKDAFCPHVFTFHRALTNFIGGAGLVLLLASMLGTHGGGMSLYVSEGHSDRLLPNIAKSAKLIFGIYVFYTVIGAIALMMAGLPAFDATCHSMSALSGGGFSPRASNVAAYRPLDGQILDGGFFPVNSLAVEIIICVLVCLSAISFLLHTFLLRGKIRNFILDDETIYIMFAGTIFLAIIFFGAILATRSYNPGNWFVDSGEIFRQSIFYSIGAVTNSGFASTTADASIFKYHIIEAAGTGSIYMGHTVTTVLIILMLIGGGTGSTAGGIKQYRIAVACRSLWYSIRYRFASIHQHYPKLTYRHGELRELSDSDIFEAFHYIFLFLALYLGLTLVLMFIDPIHYTLETAAFDMASAMSNTGLSWVIGVDYMAIEGPASHVVMWALSIGMLLGRLEIFPAVYAVSSVGEEIRYHHDMRKRAKRQAASLKMMEEE